MEMIQFIRDNFAHAGPILFVGLLGVAIVVERYFALFIYYPILRTERFYEKITELVMASKISEATDLCGEYSRKPIANVMKAALQRAHLPEGLIRDGVQIALQKATRAILKRTSFLATIANVATLLGLFGTVAGLIHSFQAVAHADAQQKSAMLSAGIAVAMNATMLGLGVAIPAMIAYSFLMNRTNAMISDLEQAAVKSLDILKQRFYAQPVSHESGGRSDSHTEMRAAS